MKALELYKQIINDYRSYDVIYKLICFNSVDAFIENPTDEEYEVIAENCVCALFKADECDLVKLADTVSKKYAEGELTLDELNKMSKWDILDLMY